MASIVSLFIWVQVLKSSIQNNILISIELLLKSFINTHWWWVNHDPFIGGQNIQHQFFGFFQVGAVGYSCHYLHTTVAVSPCPVYYFSLRRLPLGIMTSAPSQVVIILLLKPIDFIVPDCPPNSTTSPTLMGFSKARINPLTRLLIRACKPNPIPTLNAPKIIVSLSIGMPAAANANNTPMVIIEIRISRSQLPMPPFFSRPSTAPWSPEAKNVTMLETRPDKKRIRKNTKIL